MARNWSPEERRKHSEAIRKWKPWGKSTGPKTAAGKSACARNPYTHGFRSRDMVEIRALLRQQKAIIQAILRASQPPKGPL